MARWWRRRPAPPRPAAPAPLPASSPDAVAVLEERLAAVEARLVAMAGDRSLCDLSKAGAPGGVKDLEGRSAALRDVRRGLRVAGGHPAGVLARVRAEWEAELTRDEQRGPVWQRYRIGGIEELGDLGEAVPFRAPGPVPAVPPATA